MKLSLQKIVSAAVIALVMASGAFLGGCSAVTTYLRPGDSGAPYRFRIEGATEEQRTAIYRAAERCNAMTNASHQIGFADDGERAVFVVDQRDLPCSSSIGPVSGCAVDDDNDGDRDAFVSRGLNEYGLEVVTAHELLHVLGLKHVPEGAGVMAPSAGPFPFSEADINECKRVRACD